MKKLDLNKLEPNPLAATLFGTDKETVAISGYICAVDKETIVLSRTRDGISYFECPRSAVIGAFREEESDPVTLLVDVNARIKVVSSIQVKTMQVKGACCSGCSESESGISQMARSVVGATNTGGGSGPQCPCTYEEYQCVPVRECDKYGCWYTNHCRWVCVERDCSGRGGLVRS